MDNNRPRRDSRYEYEYHAEGNRTKRIKLEGAAPDLVTATGPTTDYVWDHRNRLVSVTERPTPSGAATKVVEFTYNAANDQIAQTVHLDGASGTAPDESRYFGYDQGQII